jgi:osmoprotectant transport system permease protein
VTRALLPDGLLAQSMRPLFEPDWVGRNLDRIWDATAEHVYLTGLSVGIGLLISLGLAVVALRWRRTYEPIVQLGGLLYTVPSLAAFALLVPFFGFSVTTAVIALVTYTLLILVRNIVTGIDAVPGEVVEAAEGMGYRPARRFLEIELPLALPVIIAGLRIATVTVIGLVTVTALLGLGGLGDLILAGFRGSITHPTMIITGVVGSVVLAVVADLLLLGVERLLTPWSRRQVAT